MRCGIWKENVIRQGGDGNFGDKRTGMLVSLATAPIRAEIGYRPFQRVLVHHGTSKVVSSSFWDKIQDGGRRSCVRKFVFMKIFTSNFFFCSQIVFIDSFFNASLTCHVIVFSKQAAQNTTWQACFGTTCSEECREYKNRAVSTRGQD